MSKSTKTRILASAETLFAEQGFTHTSMRMITRHANVNLAAVNYHFGNKKNLIQAVFKEYFEHTIPTAQEYLAVLESAPQVTVDAVINCIVEPLLHLEKLKPNGAALFIQLLGHGYTDAQGHLRGFIMGNYGDTIQRLMTLFKTSLPHISDVDLFWRLHFALGSFVFSMSSSSALADIAQADFQQSVELKELTQQLAQFVTAGIKQG
ncbi:TetR family transcriptional regulator [Alteromonas sp. ASW11-36]|uniref:TetR family transcriptional regulator n=1 Tax=Alteromonas arenosi TaxID=3055817 RepID=A0ABT7SX26_9ALTE|nr:TetR/AcrR family transcriptional regulator [Alteromonas sp. ASW11-36]MDM7860716.1 TetR family transcriptional regulator [Alteromonas sp. ASW11-36]